MEILQINRRKKNVKYKSSDIRNHVFNSHPRVTFTGMVVSFLWDWGYTKIYRYLILETMNE